jgi:septal ring factor EnvC (AmiA/AmiB activator)
MKYVVMPLTTTVRRRALGALVAGLLATAAIVGPTPTMAGATTRQGSPTTTSGPTTSLDPQAARARTKQRRNEVGGQISSLRASDDQVRSALAALDGKLMQANNALDAATTMLAQAQADVAAAEAAESTAKDRADEALREVKKMAIEAYVNPPANGLAIVLASGSIGEARERQSMLEIRAKARTEVLRRRRRAVANLKAKHRTAEAAVAASQAAADSQLEAVAELESTRGAHVQLVAEVDQRLNAALGEAAGLAAIDDQLAQQITAQQEQLRAEAAAREATAARAARRAAAVAPPSKSRPPKSTPTTTPPHVTPPSLYTIDDMNLVHGIYVNKLIATNFGHLWDAASAAGLSLGGGGFRDSAAQIATRRNNCGTSDYAIYVMPASQCSPPTARPGTSMHEQGMAIDITCSGTLIRDHADPCFVWLAAHAASYGFYNLPSEPWHWSVNGN